MTILSKGMTSWSIIYKLVVGPHPHDLCRARLIARTALPEATVCLVLRLICLPAPRPVALLPIDFSEHDIDRPYQRNDVRDKMSLDEPSQRLQVAERRRAHAE